MAIFKKDEPQLQKSQKPRERTAPVTRNVSGDAAISIIGEGMVVVGDIETEGIIRIEGEVRGTVRAGKAVVLGQAGVVDGDLVTADAVIGGTVKGSISASSRLELQSSSAVSGEIRTPAEHLKLDEGARFAGRVLMEEPGAEATETKQLSPPAQPRLRSASSAPAAETNLAKAPASTNGTAASAPKPESPAPAATAEVSREPEKQAATKTKADTAEESASTEIAKR